MAIFFEDNFNSIFGSTGTAFRKPVTFNGLVTFTGGTSGAGGGSSPITSTSAQAFAVGANGNTNPVLNVDASAATQATGISVQGQAAGGGVAINAISSATNEALVVTPKGTGNLTLGTGTSTTVNFGTNGASISSGGAITTNTTLATRANASLVAGGQIAIGFTSVSAFGIVVGSGAPTATAAPGSIYLRSDGSSTSTRAYISLGAGSWTAITTAT